MRPGWDPFVRLALVACAALLTGAVAAVWIFVSPWVALAAAAGGIVLAVLVTLEPVREKPEAEPEPRDEQTFAVRARPREEISRDAERAREAEEEADLED